MAAMMGISIGSLVTFEGMEDEGYSGKLKLDDKVIGTVVYAGDGGEPYYHTKDPKMMKEVETRITNFFEKYPQEFTGEDIFFSDLVYLMKQEKRYNKSVNGAKKTFKDNPALSVSMIVEEIDDLNLMEHTTFFKEGFERTKREIEERKHKYKVFNSLEDFNMK